MIKRKQLGSCVVVRPCLTKTVLWHLYVFKSAGANFWLEVLTDLQNRGVRDILICCIDGLKGFPDAIQGVFPESSVQLCVVHQIRNSVAYRQQASERLHQGFANRIRCCQQGFSYCEFRSVGCQMRRGVSYRNQVVT